jgi:hypothetical protein
MPWSIHRGELASDCEGTDCFHKQSKEIKEKLKQFKTFLETKGRFKVGDRVEIANTPVITDKIAYGWQGGKHFLVKGAKGIIGTIDYYNDHFGYGVLFDDESWKDAKGVIHPVSERSHYHFKEENLRSVGSGLVPCNFLRNLWSDFYRIGD